MIISDNNPISTPKTDLPFTHWELTAPMAQRDLIIKKITVTLIALLNFAALSIATYYIVLYTPVPTQALLVSPFIVGVLAALTYLKFPTFGVSSKNYSIYLNPAALIGRGLAYLFFGPLMYAVDHADWIPYHDPIRANKISKDLEERSFEKIVDEYGSHFSNLTKYGFIDEKYGKELQELYEEYVPIKKEIAFWKKEGLEDCVEAKAAQRQMKLMENKWRDLKNRFGHPFPHPKKTSYDFSKKSTRVKLKARSICCFGPPIDMIRGLNT